MRADKGKLNVAIVGCGWVSDWHVRDGLAHVPDKFEVIACCDTDHSKRTDFAARYGISRTTADLDEILGMEDVDVVAICTPPSTHFGMMSAALAAGKYVVCEKPLTSSLELVDKVIELEARARGQVMPVFQYRFGNGIAKIRHVIQSGLAGRPYVSTVETAKRRRSDYYSVPWRGKFATELGGVLLTQSIHNHDLLLWLLGPAASVSAAKTTRVNPIETEDCAVASLVMENGSLASLAATLGSVRELVRFRLCFENVIFERQAFDTNSSRPGDDPWEVIPANDDIGRVIQEKMAEVAEAKSGFARQYELFHEAYFSGGEMPVTLQDARRSLELITAMFYSAERGEAVSLPIGKSHPKYGGWVPEAALSRA